MRIYVIAHNGGCEGHSPPVQAFNNLEDAKAALAIVGYCFEIFSVPIWPEPAEEWFRIEPVKVVGVAA